MAKQSQPFSVITIHANVKLTLSEMHLLIMEVLRLQLERDDSGTSTAALWRLADEEDVLYELCTQLSLGRASDCLSALFAYELDEKDMAEFGDLFDYKLSDPEGNLHLGLFRPEAVTALVDRVRGFIVDSEVNAFLNKHVKDRDRKLKAQTTKRIKDAIKQLEDAGYDEALITALRAHSPGTKVAIKVL
jgi:hypothetical protein